MKGRFQRSYKKAGGTTVFVYDVVGTEDEIAAYELAQGDKLRKNEEDQPVFFTTRFAGPTVDLVMTQNDRVVADMSKFDQAASLASQYGGNLGQELARAAAGELLGFGKNTSQPQPTPKVEPKEKAEKID